MTRARTDPRTRRWAMICDDCGFKSDERPSQLDLPLQEFHDAGWFIADLFGDRCPNCVSKQGGRAVIARQTKPKFEVA